MKTIVFILICIGLFFYYNQEGMVVSSKPIADQNKVFQEPVQKNLSGIRKKKLKGGNLTLLAEYEITARVLGKKYYKKDRAAAISPVDIAMGWGDMSRPYIYEQFNMGQRSRSYSLNWSDGIPISQEDVMTSSANVHIIPANAGVKRQLDALKRENIATFKGYLVYYRKESPVSWWDWKSSLVRTDTGGEACEIMYVEHVVIY